MSADHDAIRALNDRYVKATNASDLDTFADLFADDVIYLMPDSPAVLGKDAIVDHQRDFFDRVSAVLESDLLEVEIHGDVAYSRGSGTLTTTPQGTTDSTNMQMRFVSVFKEYGDGEWKIWRSIFSLDDTPGK